MYTSTAWSIKHMADILPKKVPLVNCKFWLTESTSPSLLHPMGLSENVWKGRKMSENVVPLNPLLDHHIMFLIKQQLLGYVGVLLRMTYPPFPGIPTCLQYTQILHLVVALAIGPLTNCPRWSRRRSRLIESQAVRRAAEERPRLKKEIKHRKKISSNLWLWMVLKVVPGVVLLEHRWVQPAEQKPGETWKRLERIDSG